MLNEDLPHGYVRVLKVRMPHVTVGLEDVSTYPALFAELLVRGWTEPDCAALAGANLLRVLRTAESAAS